MINCYVSVYGRGSAAGSRMDIKAFNGGMRYSVTLKNAFNHLVNTAEGKTKRSQRCALGIGLAPEKWKNSPSRPSRAHPFGCWSLT